MGTLLRFKLDEFISTYHLQTFIETGSARGDSIDYAAQRTEFTRLLSCEIEPLLAIGCISRFHDDPRINIVRMESGLFMRLVTSSDLPPALFWLDAHYPGAGFGLGDYDADIDEDSRLPLRRELELIALHRQGEDVILIDDLRIYETGNYEGGPLPLDAPGTPTENGADWMRDLFAKTHSAMKCDRDQGYLILIPHRD
jgi:hypothetical protein